MTDYTLTFTGKTDFHAVHQAEDWLERHGFSLGPMQKGNPRGIVYGEVAVAKWRNLGFADVKRLDGVLRGDMRRGPVTITLFDKTWFSRREVRQQPAASA